MPGFENVLSRQQQLFGVISRAVENLKKLGSAKINRGSIQSRMDALKSNWDKFQSHHEELFGLSLAEQSKQPYFSDDLYSLCEETFLEAHATMLNMLDELSPVESKYTSAKNELPSANATRSHRLPRIDVPKFSGDYIQWNSFKDLFGSMIIENAEISAVEKIHYLEMSLTGEPSQHLRNIALSGDNFNRAWDTLVSRYENKRILIDAQLAALFAPRALKTENSADLKRLLGNVKEALGALENLGCPIKQWDLIVIFMLVRKLDSESLKRWEDSLGSQSNPPSFDDFEAFLVSRIYSLEALERSLPRKQQNAASPSTRSPGTRTYTATATELKCAFCSSGHYISACPKYLEKTYEQRREAVVSKNLCFNCLGPHQLKACRNTKRCRICRKQHHSSLHVPAGNSTLSSTSDVSAAQQSTALAAVLQDGEFIPRNNERSHNAPVSTHVSQSFVTRRVPVILATAVVSIRSRNGVSSQVRALVDQGSEVSFISESIAQRLKLPRRAAAIPIVGIGATKSSVSNGIVSFDLVSRINASIVFNIDALVLPRLTAYLPPKRIECAEWSHLRGIQLADPNFNNPGKIDVILGADVYARILEEGLCRGAVGTPIAQKTSLGWILSGALSHGNDQDSLAEGHAVTGLQCSLDSDLLDMLQRFWSQEEITPPPHATLTPDENQCENEFRTTHSCDIHGRFVVRLPFKRAVPDFGDSRTAALKSLHRLEKRFDRDPKIKFAYSEFLREYLELDHMSRVISPDRTQPREFYLPHHGVVRENSATSKLRVVFNGSQKSSLGFSLNDVLHVGPKLQTDLMDIILRWRRHRFVFAADIEKMYRQIRVHADDWPLQTILWRNSSHDAIHAYHLCTVTYGLTCAPYLALRCLQQLALETDESHELAAGILRQDTYVDDILSGAESITQAKEQVRQLNEVLRAGGFKLRKWISNNSDVLADVPSADLEPSISLVVDDRATHHTLGMQWNRQSDRFLFVAPSPPKSHLLTKRSVLSFIARLFDPLGWLAPMIITAKIFLQELWAIRLDWDEELPQELASRWVRFMTQIDKVTAFAVPRWFGLCSSALAIELHGFCDASQSAYAAVVYVRVFEKNNDPRVTLVSAKSKVAPLKRLSIPRLELSAAVLLVRQIIKIRDVLELQHTPLHLWTDSTVALAWIKGHPSKWKEFVRNRVSFIQEFSNSRWHHVSGKENPADLASRGVSHQVLHQEQLWWTGPAWLRSSLSAWPSSTMTVDSSVDLEDRHVSCATAVSDSEPALWDLITRYSSLSSLTRITAWLFRSRDRFRNTATARPYLSTPTPLELDAALIFWVKLSQHAYFSNEIRTLTSGKHLSKSSSLYRLSPFLDNELLRLRGRLQHSQLDPTEKHPLILPRESRLTTLVIDHYHRRTLHGGPQLTLASIRQRFWIVGGRVPIRSFIHRCVTCVRQRGAAGQQYIGQLPASRVTPGRAFTNTGIDYAGPLTLKTFRGRGAKSYKGYLVIFVCLSTSAIHLEIASDYTTDGFISAYKRFTGRRGLCSSITSDCGTNLIGADAELKRMFTASSKESARIASLLASEGVRWRFNPPSAPHFGGKWEAGVKSVKHHLRRVLGDTALTYEELSTLLAQIEAVLNSRPLTALSDDPTDTAALTPGHFLVGSALTAVPEPSTQDLPRNRLSRLQLLRQMTESFWHR